jgi:hypothetical protein
MLVIFYNSKYYRIYSYHQAKLSYFVVTVQAEIGLHSELPTAEKTFGYEI